MTQITVNVGYYHVIVKHENDFWSTTLGKFVVSVIVGIAVVAVLASALGLGFHERRKKSSYLT